MQSDDPDFETKAADVIGPYLNPPNHAIRDQRDDLVRADLGAGSEPHCGCGVTKL